MISATRSSDAVRCDDLTVALGGRPVLHGVTFAAAAGAITAVVGPNGAGKSTLLDAIAGVLLPRTGDVSITGDSVAYVPQRAGVAERLPATVRDVVAVGAWGRRGAFRPLDADARSAVQNALRLLDLVPLARRPFAELSGGQRQRTLLAQGLARGADVLLLDEPTTGLDTASTASILSAINAERARGVAVLCVTHDPALTARADLVVRLEEGRVIG